MSVKVLYPEWGAICPKCKFQNSTLTQYLNYGELPQEEYNCPKCGLKFYHVNMHVGIMSTGNALWTDTDFKKFYKYAIEYCKNQLKNM